MTNAPLRSATPDRLDGPLAADDAPAPLDDAMWYVADGAGAALVYDLPEGALADAADLTTDLLLDGERTALFRLTLHEADDGRSFTVRFGLLNRCQARVRIPLSAVDIDEWRLDREGAWSKPMVGGERVDPARVDRVEIEPVPWTTDRVRWCQTPLEATATEPPRLTDPTLPDGPLLDEFGQSTLHEWDGRTENEAELVERLRRQRRRARESRVDDGPAGSARDDRDDWGGWTGREFEATEFFRTHHDGDRWWLVTPDGHPFWSTGLVGVESSVRTRYDGIEDALSWLPDEDGAFADAHEDWGEDGAFFDYLRSNLIRAFGPDDWRDAWRDVAFGQLRRLGVNTVGNWSDWEAASDAGVPYVRQVDPEFPGVPTAFRNFPDVFHEAFRDAAAETATQLEDSVGDPAMIGYFVGNQPNWKSGDRPLAEDVLRTAADCATRRELADWLAARHDDTDLADAWEMNVTLDEIRSGSWDRALTDAARSDLEAFSVRMVDRYYEVVADACRAVDPDHLFLGSRFRDLDSEWLRAGMAHVDVVTLNCYRPRVPEEFGEWAAAIDAPIMVGEFTFSALDVGLPAPGHQRVPDQAARGDAYRVYLEHAAAQPWCVGAHFYAAYDESALGRFDGQNCNLGFFDVCHRPYEPLIEAARESHERVYDLATGAVDPLDEDPTYLTGR